MPVLRPWLDSGMLAMRFDETVGLDKALVAYCRLLTGVHIGKVIVRVAG